MSPSKKIRFISCVDAYALVSINRDVLFLDVRTEFEHNMIGHPIDSVLIPWQLDSTWEKNSKFEDMVESIAAARNKPIVLICRTGHRALKAAEKLEEIGYFNIYVVTDGFEGELDENGRRSTRNGWRFEGLPWQQV